MQLNYSTKKKFFKFYADWYYCNLKTQTQYSKNAVVQLNCATKKLVYPTIICSNVIVAGLYFKL